MNTHDRMRQALIELGITPAEVVAEMRREEICTGHEQDMVDQLVGGGKCSMGVAIAVFAIIVRQNSATRH